MRFAQIACLVAGSSVVGSLASHSSAQDKDPGQTVKIVEGDIVSVVGLPTDVVKGDLNNLNKATYKFTTKYKDKLTAFEIKSCAITAYKSFRSEQTVDDLKFTINVKALEVKLFQKTGVLKVTSRPSGAQLILDGNSIDKTDTACVVGVGKHKIVVKLPPKFMDTEEECTVDEDDVTTVAVTLKLVPVKP